MGSDERKLDVKESFGFEIERVENVRVYEVES